MKAILLSILILAASSCSMLMDEIIEYGMTGFNEYYMAEWEALNTYSSIARYIRVNVEYTSDSGISDTQSPERTISRGKGDCEDMALLFMNIANVSMGIDMDAVIVDQPERAIEAGGIDFNHVAVRYNGVTIDAQLGTVKDYPVKYSYTYQEVFSGTFTEEQK